VDGGLKYFLIFDFDPNPTISNKQIKKMSNIPFQTIDWTSIEKVEYQGETGVAFWQTIQFAGLRIRLIEYSNEYVADHWCQKGHIVHCLEGEFTSELSTGEKFVLKKGDTYVVSDELSSHRSISENGVKLLIIDGDFLKLN
jgi:quercetin dioxygenase-like cupin family protein